VLSSNGPLLLSEIPHVRVLVCSDWSVSSDVISAGTSSKLKLEEPTDVSPNEFLRAGLQDRGLDVNEFLHEGLQDRALDANELLREGL